MNNKATWHMRYADDSEGEIEFNRQQIAKRRDLPFIKVLNEWDESFSKQIGLLRSLTDEEWLHQSGNDVYNEGSPVTVWSLFAYEYEGEGHEGGHAKQIKMIIRP